jgi:hypothetical protein
MNRILEALSLAGALALGLAGCKSPLDSALLDKTKDSLLGAAALRLSLAGLEIPNDSERVPLAASVPGGISITRFTLRNPGGRPLAISSASIEFVQGSASFSTSAIFPVILAPGETSDFELSFSPGSVQGSQSANVSFASNDPAAARYRFSAIGSVSIAAAKPEIWRSETIAGCMPGHDGVGTRAGLSNPRDLIAIGTTLYLADATTVRSIDTATMRTFTLAGACGESSSIDGSSTAARFSGAQSIASDGTRLYIADGSCTCPASG